MPMRPRAAGPEAGRIDEAQLTAEMRARLEDAPWARDLDEPQIDRMLRETQIVRYLPGAIVCHEGEQARHWIGVLDGLVKVDTVSEDGKCTTFIGVSTGGWLGEGSLLKSEARAYEVVTLSESWIALLPKETFGWLFETSLSFNHFLVRQLNARLGHFVSVVESSRMQSTVAQVAVCLAGLFSPQFGQSASDAVRISQEEIARLCGLSRQITARALHELEQAGLLKMQYGGIHVPDPHQLHMFGRSGTAYSLSR